MVRSMTGFGRSETITPEYKLTVEMKAVNHRYSEISIKMPRKFNMFEAGIRALLKEEIERGKVDVFISFTDEQEAAGAVKYNANVAKEYYQHLLEMQQELGLTEEISATRIAMFPDVFTHEDQPFDEDRLWGILQDGIRKAMANFVQARETEGANLQKDLLAKLDHMEELVAFIEEKMPTLQTAYKDRLEAKVGELLAGSGVEESRIAAEVVIYADKICVDEETVRLKSHISGTKDMLTKGGSIGRKLDFIAQEMNREANTILSKADALEITDAGIELKTEIEKVREQIQNIE